jgi:trehalose 2-sulfotransferase
LEQATLTAVTQLRTTANGVFAIKAHFSHCKVLGGPEAFLRFWPNLKVVHICRADVLRQAISYAIAKQTGVWIEGQEAEQERAECDPRLIAECLDDIAVQNARWISAFAEAGIRPFSVRYGEAVENLQDVMTRVARHVGAVGPDDVAYVTATTRRQGKPQRTDDWIDAYAEKRRAGRWPGLRLPALLARS